MRHLDNPNEITRESLVRILDIMHRLAAPEAMPELLREIIEVGKVAIVAETGVLWLLDKNSQQLVMVVPASDNPARLSIGQGWAGKCASDLSISNIHECRDDGLFLERPVHIKDGETRSLLNIPILGSDDSLLGVMQWLGAEVGQFDEHDEWVGPALAAQAAVAIQHSYMTDELLANAILNQEVAVAREIQMSTLPDTMPDVAGYDLHGHFQPTDHTGGDLGMTPERYELGTSIYALQFAEKETFYLIALAFWAFGIWVWKKLDVSMDRYAMEAISEDEDAAASVGIHVTRQKLKIKPLQPCSFTI